VHAFILIFILLVMMSAAGQTRRLEDHMDDGPKCPFDLHELLVRPLSFSGFNSLIRTTVNFALLRGVDCPNDTIIIQSPSPLKPCDSRNESQLAFHFQLTDDQELTIKVCGRAGTVTDNQSTTRRNLTRRISCVIGLLSRYQTLCS
jgi:hypothetical protein